jgi:hydroxymethylpyrimidine/phosphomethylpyrimidine kinase
MKTALTIAGSDSGGGAGIQADLKTFSAFGVFGTSAITALTAQNTVGVQGIHEIPPEFVAAQIESVATDIAVDACKTGMLASSAIVEVVAATIRKHGLKNLVVDPVMIAKSGDFLLAAAARRALIEELLPLAAVVMPNLPEAEAITGLKVDNLAGMKEAARRIREIGCSVVVVKGGHRSAAVQADRAAAAEAVDVVYDGEEFTLLRAPFHRGKVIHGTGCTLSAAVAAGLAQGKGPLDAIRRAKDFISGAIATSLVVGKGHTAPDHFTGTATDWV